MNWEYIIGGIVCGIGMGVLFILAAIFKWDWLLEGNGWLENRFQLAEKLWYRIVVGISGGIWIAVGIWLAGAGMGAW